MESIQGFMDVLRADHAIEQITERMPCMKHCFYLNMVYSIFQVLKLRSR